MDFLSPGCRDAATLSTVLVADSVALSKDDFWESGVRVSWASAGFLLAVGSKGDLCQFSLVDRSLRRASDILKDFENVVIYDGLMDLILESRRLFWSENMQNVSYPANASTDGPFEGQTRSGTVSDVKPSPASRVGANAEDSRLENGALRQSFGYVSLT